MFSLKSNARELSFLDTGKPNIEKFATLLSHSLLEKVIQKVLQLYSYSTDLVRNLSWNILLRVHTWGVDDDTFLEYYIFLPIAYSETVEYIAVNNNSSI